MLANFAARLTRILAGGLPKGKGRVWDGAAADQQEEAQAGPENFHLKGLSTSMGHTWGTEDVDARLDISLQN